MRIARPRAGWRHDAHRSVRRASGIAAARKDVSITAITGGRIAPA
jgi:hypothetical protein